MKPNNKHKTRKAGNRSQKASFEQGRVIACFGRNALIDTGAAKPLRCQLRGRDLRPVCGDVVQWQMADRKGGIIESIEPRNNHFDRADGRGRRQTIAANLDQIIVVIAPRPAPSTLVIDAYLVACRQLDIPARIVLNKADLLEADDALLARREKYQALGFEIPLVCAKTGEGIDALQALCRDKTSILVGQSGVGKSALSNNLLPDKDIETGELSEATGKGTHTTTTTRLYALPGGGSLLDSPGVWEYGIWPMTAAEIAEGFPDFQDFVGHCRFHNCVHQAEPDCAIKDAVAAGQVEAHRYDAFLTLVEQSAKAKQDNIWQ